MSIWNEVLNSGARENKEEVRFVKFNEGANNLRILDEEPVAVWKHWVQGANGGKGMSIVCLGKNCPMCEKNKSDKANNLKTKDRIQRVFIINVYNRATKQVEVLEKGTTIFKTLATFHEQMGDLRNYDVNILKTGQGLNTAYTVIPVMKSPEVPEGLEKYDIEANNKPLSVEMVNLLMAGLTYEEANKTLGGETKSSDDDLEVDFTQD